MTPSTEVEPSSDLIARRAYEIWQHEGRPAGRAADHWQRAEREILSGQPSAMVSNTSSGVSANSAATAARSQPSASSGNVQRKSADNSGATSEGRAASGKRKKN